MSYLNGPRINFWGGFQTDVCTTNNEDYTLPDGTSVIDVIHTTVTNEKTDSEILDYFRTHSERKGHNYYTNGGWNYYGDYGVRFIEASVSSAGQPGEVSTTDPSVGLPVYLLGSVDPDSGDGPFGSALMVDLDPTSSQTTQIYVGGLQIGPSDNPALLIQGDAVCHARFLALRLMGTGYVDAPGSYQGNGTFQVTFPLSAVKSYDESNAAIKAIMDAPGVRGIVLRFSIFECLPYMTTPELQADYAANRNSSNPSSGNLIGTIGPAFEGEPDTDPPGRWLENPALPGFAPNSVASGVGIVNQEAHLFSLDAVSLLQKAGLRADRKAFTGPPGPNMDYGSLTISAGGSAVATFDPLPDSYYQYGGIFDIEMSSEALSTLNDNVMTITGSGPGGSLSVSEKALRIYTNARNLYLDDYADGAVIILQVRYLGGPLPVGRELALTSGATGILDNPNFVNFPAIVNIQAGAKSVSFKVSDNGGAAGYEALYFTAGSDSSDIYINFRKYPVGDLPTVPAGGPDWDYIYTNVLRYFYTVFPAMSKRINLNFEGSINATAPVIMKRISSRYRPTTLYMPITRAMSPERVAVFEDYLKLHGG